MAAYRPGQGISGAALERLRERKCKESGIADIPAEDKNDQWDRLLGNGSKKKLRCGVCTRPLSDKEQAEKRLVCFACAAGGKGALASPQAALASHEFGNDVLYYYLGAAPAAQPMLLPRTVDARHVKCASGLSARAEASADVDGITARARAPVLARGAPIHDCLSSCLVPESRTPFSVLSFNILADCYVRVDGQPWNAFEYCDDAHLAWDRRLPSIIQLLAGSAADIVCLQEVALEKRTPSDGGTEEWGLPSWTEELKEYVGVLQGLKQKEWEGNSERNLRAVGKKTPTGVATFYRSTRFEECAVSKHGSGSGATVFLRCKDVPRDGGAPMEVAIANIHLVGDPAKFDSHLKALDSVKKNIGKQALRMICGDFNGECEPGSEVAAWFTEEGFAEAPTGTSWAAPGDAKRLDHIFYSGDLSVVAASGPLSAEEVVAGLPCSSCPSDHAPVAALLTGAAKGRCPW